MKTILHKINPFERYRHSGVRDFGDDSILEINIIYNAKDEYVATSIGEHGTWFTFGYFVKFKNIDTAINFRPSSESGIFKGKIEANLYGLGYLFAHSENLSKEAIDAIQKAINRIQKPVRRNKL